MLLCIHHLLLHIHLHLQVPRSDLIFHPLGELPVRDRPIPSACLREWLRRTRLLHGRSSRSWPTRYLASCMAHCWCPSVLSIACSNSLAFCASAGAADEVFTIKRPVWWMVSLLRAARAPALVVGGPMLLPSATRILHNSRAIVFISSISWQTYVYALRPAACKPPSIWMERCIVIGRTRGVWPSWVRR